MTLSPFDYVTAIYTKGQVDDELAGFNPYLCQWSLSNNLDTCLLANEMNAHPNLPPRCQFDFLYGAVSKGNRWGKWNKPSDNPHLEMVMNHYKINKQKALEALTLLTQRELKAIADLSDKYNN